MYCFGPRYLLPLIPILLLPLGGWVQRIRWKTWLVVISLAVIGLWVQLTHVAVNFWKVVLHENYLNLQPQYSFLFNPNFAPLVAQSKAFLTADGRVDMWLINVYRTVGPGRTITLIIPLLILCAFFLWRLWKSLRREATASTIDLRVSFRLRYAFLFLVTLLVFAGMVMGIDYRSRMIQEKKRLAEISEIESAGFEALYKHQDSERASKLFNKVLEKDPFHYKATFHLAIALDRLGKKAEAHPLWERALRMAEIYQDKSTADMARARIQKGHGI